MLSKPIAVPKPDHCTRKATHDRKAKSFRDAAWKLHGFKNADNEEVGHCARCRRFLIRGVNGTVDHIKPRSTHPELKYDVTNARLACGTCQTYWKTHPLERD